MEPRSITLPVVVPPGETGQRLTVRLLDNLRSVRGVTGASLNNALDTLRLIYDPVLLSADRLDYVLRQSGVEIAVRIEQCSFLLTGLDSPDTARQIGAHLNAYPGVICANVNFALTQVQIAFLPHLTSGDALAQQIRAPGVRSQSYHASTPAPKFPDAAFILTLFAAIFCGVAWSVQDKGPVLSGFPLSDLLYGAALLLAGEKPLRSALQKRTLNSDSLAVVSALGLLALGNLGEAAFLLTTVRGGKTAMEGLLRSLRRQAGQAEIESPSADFAAALREAFGLPVPQEKAVQTSAQRLARLFTLLAVGTAFVVPLLTAGGLTWTLNLWLHRGLTMLPLADTEIMLVLASLFGTAALLAAARQNVLLRGGAVFSVLHSAHTLIYAKSGVLTQGTLVMEDTAAFGGWACADVLRVAALLEADSDSPLSQALQTAAASRRGLPLHVADRQRVPGLGLSAVMDETLFFLGTVRWLEMHGVPIHRGVEEAIAEAEGGGKIPLLLGGEGGVVGVMVLADKPRSGFVPLVEDMRRLGVTRQILFSGESVHTTLETAQAAGLDGAEGNLTREEQAERLRQIQQEAGTILTFGRGRDDLPFVLAADAGIALYDTEQPDALHFADIALPSNDLNALPAVRMLARQAHTRLAGSLTGVVGIKFLLLICAAFLTFPAGIAALAGAGLALTAAFFALRFVTAQSADSAAATLPSALSAENPESLPLHSVPDTEPLLHLVFIHDSAADEEPMAGRTYPHWKSFSVPFYGVSLRFGRKNTAQDVDIPLEDEGVSRLHGEFRLEGKRPVVVDLGSTNGIRRNGQAADALIPPQKPVSLKFGDALLIGRNTRIEIHPPHSLKAKQE